MRDKVSIGLIVYFLLAGIAAGRLFWRTDPALSLILAIPMVGGAIFGIILAKKRSADSLRDELWLQGKER